MVSSILSRLVRSSVGALVVAMLIGGGAVTTATTASAQAVNGNNGRVCQTVRRCNFTRGGVFRGCISAFSCQRCRTVRVRCNAAARRAGRRFCTRLNCDFRGV